MVMQANPGSTMKDKLLRQVLVKKESCLFGCRHLEMRDFSSPQKAILIISMQAEAFVKTEMESITKRSGRGMGSATLRRGIIGKEEGLRNWEYVTSQASSHFGTFFKQEFVNLLWTPVDLHSWYQATLSPLELL